MNTQKMIGLTNDIVQAYYQNDLQPFFDYVDEDVLWYGPAKGQFLSGRQAVLDAWGREKNPLTFSVGNVRLDCAASHPSYCEILMSFPVTTHYSDGESIRMDQIIHITWCERRLGDKKLRQPRMLVIHISDLYQKHEEDTIYPIHFNQTYKGYMPIAESGRRVHFRGTDRADHYLLSDTILWVESCGNGKRSILHMEGGGTLEVIAPVQSIEADHSDFLLRCHMCYLVNPRHVAQVKRFRVALADGTELPIPEKKYTAFKKAVKAYGWNRRF